MPLQAHTSAIGSGGGVRVGIQRRRQPLQGRQIPAKKKGCLSARANQRHTTAPLGVFLSGSAKAVAGTTQRCWRSSQSRHRWFFRLRKLVP